MEHDTVAFFDREYPLIRIFPYADDFLIYDAKPHFACILSSQDLAVLADFLQEKPEPEIVESHRHALGSESLRKLLAKYGELQRDGVFLKGPVAKISPVEDFEIRKHLKYFDENILLRKFCLEVTEDCNYRCRYCKRTIASDYRGHGKTELSENNARKAIDYYFLRYTEFFRKLSPEKKEVLLDTVPPALSWYGGEPFLNFPLIKKSAGYFKSLPWEEHGIETGRLKFSSNTNLSVMTDEILNFLTANGVHLFVSLDGPEEEHDKYRVFADGTGTFRIAYRNLLKIKEFDETYFRERVSIFGVRAADHDFMRCTEFTRGLGAAGCQHFSAEYTGIFVPDPETASESYRRSIENGLAEFKDKVLADSRKDHVDMDGYAHLFPFAKLRYDRPSGKDELDIFVTCPMGFDNLMVTAGGKFLVCHKINDGMPIGDCDAGLDFEKLLEFNKRYNQAINNQACRSCWNVHFCSICAASRMVQDRFVNPTAEECDFFRLRASHNFLCFIHLSLEHPDFLNKIFEYRNDRKRYIGIIDKNDL